MYVQAKGAIGNQIANGSFTPHLMLPRPGLHLLASGFAKVFKFTK